jgi:hypothetical protein
MPTLPEPRGPIGERLLPELASQPHSIALGEVRSESALSDEDLQLSLYVAYELHYRGFDDVHAEWEWEPSLIALRRELERSFEDSLLAKLGPPQAEGVRPEEMDLALRGIADSDEAPSLSQHVERDATLDEFREFMIHRSAYQLKEADPHTWAIPRMWGSPKAAIVEVQADEYGGGRPERIHSRLFADAMAAIGLDPTYGAYLDEIPGVTLATVNLMSMLGLHRRWLGAIVGHLALFEMTSSVPNRRYSEGLRRLGFGGDATEFFDEHVMADAVHESIAAVDLAGGLARQSPELTGDILWGARALLFLEGRWAAHLLDAWAAGHSSLRRRPAAAPA